MSTLQSTSRNGLTPDRPILEVAALEMSRHMRMDHAGPTPNKTVCRECFRLTYHLHEAVWDAEDERGGLDPS